MSRKPKSLASASAGVQAVLKSGDLWNALRPHMAKAKWADVVGPQVAAVTQVERAQGTVLVVRVKNSVWANELSLLKGDMLRRLNQSLGGQVLTDIRFKASGLAREKTSKHQSVITELPDTDTLASVALSRDALGRITLAAASITDDTLRARVRASLLRAARLEAWKRAQCWHVCARCGTLFPPDDLSPLCSLCRVVPLSSTTSRL